MAYLPESVSYRIVPGYIYMIIRTVNLNNIPCMTHSIAACHITLNPQFLHNIHISICICLANPGSIHKQPAASVRIIRHRTVQVIIIIIFVCVYKIVMNRKCLFFFRHIVRHQCYNFIYFLLNLTEICFCFLHRHSIFHFNIGITISV